MAQRVITELVSDLSNAPADETVTFGLDGVTYEIEVTAQEAEALREGLAAYVGAGRRVGGRKAARGATARQNGSEPSPKVIREWAKANGYEVPARGRVPADVREAFKAAMAS